jgi:hypothetical protein
LVLVEVIVAAAGRTELATITDASRTSRTRNSLMSGSFEVMPSVNVLVRQERLTLVPFGRTARIAPGARRSGLCWERRALGTGLVGLSH